MLQKHHKIVAFFLAGLAAVVIYVFTSPQPIFRFLLPAFLLYSGLVFWYNQKYLRSMEKYNVWTNLRFLLLLFGVFGLYLTIPNTFLRILYLPVAVLAIALFEILLGREGENVLLNETLLAAFALFFSFSAFYQYIPAHNWLYVIGVFAAGWLLSRAFYEFMPQSEPAKLVGSVALGLFCSELFWALSFLPFHFSTAGLLLFIAFYFCLIMNYYYLLHSLNFKKIKFHLYLIGACAFLVLLSTPWNILK